ncbi:SAM50-like protein SPAC17C9.06 [Ceratocystis fimbriata CBS 114723]|uniref:SAM50-like protein SPAC17C9.06 n=1 Tax=Ceratocystis fimbriata CBS 114723 TaxID=1035309 RepID=A0A2C5XBK0_9PEZI|nr:SAM50-like protein SPAC17C9.06 [Ceratocystis fimbriata CBS 114723]
MSLTAVQKLQADPSQLAQGLHSDADFQKLDAELRKKRLERLFLDQHSKPLTVNRVRIHGATNVRHGFLNPIIAPLVDDNDATTVGDVLLKLRDVSHKLESFDLFHPNPQVWLSDVDATDPSSTVTDTDIDIRVREMGRFLLKGGTDFGNGEGSGYGSLLWRNVFGGAEMLTLNASRGTRTRSAYNASLSMPLFSNPDVRLAFDSLASMTEKLWASHEEILFGGIAKLSWLSKQRDMHSVEYTSMLRKITSLGSHASPTVRHDAGDSLKNSLKHTFSRERRDNPNLPQSGYHLRSAVELAGLGPMGGDVSFVKSELNTGGALPIPIPGIKGRSGVSIGAGLHLGILYPLAQNLVGAAKPSRINDRFQLGGPTDVRGFRLGGLGPHDLGDAVGGDVSAAGSVNLLVPFPGRGVDSALRLQAFANAGRLVALSGSQNGKGGSQQPGLMPSLRSTLLELTNGPPSIAAGVGIVYAHPVARFELNFGLPITMRSGEDASKGFQVGVGINFM